jgi:hypothetical protein
MHEPSISVGRVQLNRYNWKAFINDEYEVWKERTPRRAAFMKLYGKMIGPILNLQERFA